MTTNRLAFNGNGKAHADPSVAIDIRLPPQNLDAERCVLGCVLRDNEVLDDLIPLLHPESFYVYAHQKIYAAFLEMRNDRQSVIDLVTLAEFIRERKLADEIGGYGYLAQLWDAVATSGSVLYYAGIVREKAIARELIKACTDRGGIVEEAYAQSKSGNELLTIAERRIFRIAEMGESGSSVPLRTAIEESCARLDELRAGKAAPGLATGFIDLDRMTAGLHPEFILLAARPSCGKTALGLQIARNIAVEHQKAVFFASLEQGRISLADRLLCAQARVDSHVFRRGKLNRENTEKIAEAADLLRDVPLFIDHTPNQSVLRISANARRHRLRHNIELVVIDYLQLIEPENRRDSENIQLTVISRRLKNLQRELGIPVLCLAQLNREVEHRTQGRPRLADLRGSGSLEQDADTVLLLWPQVDPNANGNNQAPTLVEVLVEKQRNGPTGSFQLIFDKRFTLFENAALERQPFQGNGNDDQRFAD